MLNPAALGVLELLPSVLFPRFSDSAKTLSRRLSQCDFLDPIVVPAGGNGRGGGNGAAERDGVRATSPRVLVRHRLFGHHRRSERTPSVVPSRLPQDAAQLIELVIHVSQNVLPWPLVLH